jgi:type III pantothenate kinase
VILAIDAGNSRSKWGVFDEAGELQSHGAIPNKALSGMPRPEAWQGCSRAVVSNVGGEGVADCLNTLLGPLAGPAYWVKPEAKACGVLNSYQAPERLGADRWAAAVAAWDRYRAPCIVVNAGTAMTVDALGMKDGEGVFLGGIIVPGLRLMEESLVSRAAGISHADGNIAYFPTDTGDAIITGALSAMAGAVNSMKVKLEQHAGQVPHCIVSGGDAPVLHEMLVRFRIKQLAMAEHLVLRGLWLLDKEKYETGKGR